LVQGGSTYCIKTQQKARQRITIKEKLFRITTEHNNQLQVKGHSLEPLLSEYATLSRHVVSTGAL